MDPNATLAQIRDLVAQQNGAVDLDDDDILTLCERFEALDVWLTNGGFPPADWCRFQPTNPQGSN